MKPYPKYKDSEVEWIGNVPEGWEVQKIKWIALINPSKIMATNRLGIDDEITFLPMENVGEKGELNTSIRKKLADVLNGFTYFDKSDVIVAKITPCFENGKGASLRNLPTDIGFGSTEFHVLRPMKVDQQFLFYITKSYTFMKLGVASMTGVAGQRRVPTAFIENFILGLPEEIGEQSRIATYLDHNTAQIDDLMTKKRQLIELLKEERATVINQAVTKGLDASVRMKDSEVEWIGKMPAHWKVIKLKYLVVDLESGVSVNATDLPCSEQGMGVLKTSCVYTYSFDPLENKEIWDSEIGRARTQPRKNSIIISRMNTPELVGASGYVDKDYPNLFLPDRLWQTIFRDTIEISVKWLSFVMKSESFKSVLSSIATGTSPSMKNISKEGFLGQYFPHFDYEEQAAIANYLDQKTTQIDQTITKTEKQIQLLQEYRTALISDVVTGKIDVREGAAA